MMDTSFYQKLAQDSMAGTTPERETCRRILSAPEIELLPLLHAAYTVRKEFTGKEVILHIINNAQNGLCPEDCHYCAQAKTSRADIIEYPLKSDEEILNEAKQAYENGAYRYCMVFAGRGPSRQRIEQLARLIREIKSRYPIEICVSAGIMGEDKTRTLKEAGLDRFNHNLNTSQRHYPEICTTHTYQDRVNTLKAARAAGLQLCSGLIAGMGETMDDLIDIGLTLRQNQTESIPVNFLIPIPGNLLDRAADLTPEYCLRILCLYRFLNPRSEIRVAAGREVHLRSMEVLALYPANSLFLQGYLNTKGSENARTLQMIKDAGFTIKSEFRVDELLEGKKDKGLAVAAGRPEGAVPVILKGIKDLRPHL